jgi:hypothetical protein
VFVEHPLKIQNFVFGWVVGRIANALLDGHALQKCARGELTFNDIYPRPFKWASSGKERYLENA